MAVRLGPETLPEMAAVVPLLPWDTGWSVVLSEGLGAAISW